MIVVLRANGYLRLERAAGATLEVLRGRAWITEAGRERDAVLQSGMRYRVGSDGQVLLSAESEVAARLAPGARRRPARLLERIAGWLRARRAAARLARTRRELEGFTDHMLRDIGLRRDQIESAVRGRSPL
jgi:uncharacterized protein YjiS (DUF1127 family)